MSADVLWASVTNPKTRTLEVYTSWRRDFLITEDRRTSPLTRCCCAYFRALTPGSTHRCSQCMKAEEPEDDFLFGSPAYVAFVGNAVGHPLLGEVLAYDLAAYLERFLLVLNDPQMLRRLLFRSPRFEYDLAGVSEF